MSEILIIITGASVIAAIVLFWLKLNKSTSSAGKEEIDGLIKERDTLSSDKRVLEANVQSLTERLQKSENILDGKEKNILELNRQLSTKTADFINIDKKLQEQKAELEVIQEKFRTEFKNLANEILEEKTQKFTEQNKVKLDEILKPLGEKIRDFEKKVEETYDKESKQRFSLEKEIKNLADLNQQISKEANNLTNALKGQSKTRGNWGEIILESILEKSGLVRDREYFVQPSFTNEHGKRVQPDIVVTYPGERNVVIDSKVSLNAYERYASSEIKEEQESALKDHLNSIRNHINDLSSKNYQDLYQLKSLDFVMMFLPIEPAYLIAMQYDPNLWNFAYERRILMISPTNLIAALKMIATLWRVEYQNKNAQEIAEQSGALYDKFVGFLEDLKDVGNKLTSTQKSYDDSINKLSDGKGNLIRRVERIKELGARTSKEIPKNLIDKAEDGGE
jgi:DNA recombination protein RmuC